MAAINRGRGGSIFGAFEVDAQTVANLADNFKPRSNNWNLHGRSQSFSKAEFFEQSDQADYARAAALPVPDDGVIVR
jgi:hypothetical protein